MALENPYSPPEALTSELPDAPVSSGWLLVGKTVWAENEAQFPMVDPYSGSESETMMLERVKLRYRPNWLSFLPILGGTAGLLFSLKDGREMYPSFVSGLFWCWILSYVVGLFFPVITLQLFFTKRFVRVRIWLGWFMFVGLLMFSIGIFGYHSNDDWALVAKWFILAGTIIFLLVLIAQFLTGRRLHCSRKKGSRYAVTGFHRRALAAFEIDQAGREGTSLRHEFPHPQSV